MRPTIKPSPQARWHFLISMTLISSVFITFLGWGVFQSYSEPRRRRLTPKIEEREERQQINRIRQITKGMQGRGRAQDWIGVLRISDTPAIDLTFAMMLMRMEALERLGRTDEAARELRPTLRVDDFMSQAEWLAFANKKDEYRTHLEQRLASIGTTKLSSLEANNIAWSCVLLPETLTSYQSVVALAEQAAREAVNPQERFTYLNTRGVAYFRAGQNDRALADLQTCEKIKSDPTNWPFLALANQRLGDTKTAQSWANKYRRYIDGSFGGGSTNRSEALLFFRELSKSIQTVPAPAPKLAPPAKSETRPLRPGRTSI